MANVETIEAQLPIRYLFRRRLIDSGGPGKFRGGAGGELAIVAHDVPDGGIHYVLSGKGSRFPQSDGLCGGYPGAVNDYVWVHAPQQAHNIDRFAQGLGDIPGDDEPISWGVFPLMGDDALYVHWNGGGGIGDPLERPPEKSQPISRPDSFPKPPPAKFTAPSKRPGQSTKRPPRLSVKNCARPGWLQDRDNEEAHLGKPRGRRSEDLLRFVRPRVGASWY
jgi:hypothetical protein